MDRKRSINWCDDGILGIQNQQDAKKSGAKAPLFIWLLGLAGCCQCRIEAENQFIGGFVQPHHNDIAISKITL